MSKTSSGALDPETGSAINVDLVEQEMHNCEHFFISGTDIMASGAEKFVTITVPAGKHFRFRWDISSTAQLETALYKSPTITGAGTAMTVQNSRSDCTNIAEAVVKNGVTVSSNGTLWDPARWGERKFGGASNAGDGLILCEGTYLRYMKSNAPSNEVTFKAYWAEHNN